MDSSEFGQQKTTKKLSNNLPFNGNETSMNLNPLILTNIQSSSYFKVKLFKLKTYHEVIDEIYYQVKHLEPWERGSRKTSGQTGMCGGVRGVGAGGIVSSAFCLLYKLYTLRLTRKQVNGLINHTDSPYIRALGYMYIRYTQPPADLFDWYEDYLQDEEEIDVKAGGGQMMTIGQMLFQWLTKLDWFGTLFPRIPVPVQKQIETKVGNYCREHNVNFASTSSNHAPEPEKRFDRGGADRNERGDRCREAERSNNRGERDYRNERSNRYDDNNDARKRGGSNRSRSRSRSKDRRHRRSRSKDRRSRERYGSRERYSSREQCSSKDYDRRDKRDHGRRYR